MSLFVHQIRSDQSLSRVRLFATPWMAAHQASLSITNSIVILYSQSTLSDSNIATPSFLCKLAKYIFFHAFIFLSYLWHYIWIEFLTTIILFVYGFSFTLLVFYDGHFNSFLSSSFWFILVLTSVDCFFSFKLWFLIWQNNKKFLTFLLCTKIMDIMFSTTGPL